MGLFADPIPRDAKDERTLQKHLLAGAKVGCYNREGV